jgi:hypothetical protein
MKHFDLKKSDPKTKPVQTMLGSMLCLLSISLQKQARECTRKIRWEFLLLVNERNSVGSTSIGPVVYY